VIMVLWQWRHMRPAPEARSSGFREALYEGLRYVRSSRVYHAVLTRAGLFSFAGSALWAMLPVVASAELGSTSTGYGILLGCLGAGSVIGAAALAPLRQRYSRDALAATGIIAFAGATAALALLHQFAMVALAILIGGVAWMTVMTTFNVCAQ